MELILVRHAQPLAEETSDGRPADPELSEAGVDQARAVANWLAKQSVDRIVSSPAKRAQRTANLSATRLGLAVSVDERLCDANPDDTRYVPLEDDRERDPEAYRARLLAYQASPAWTSVSRRVNDAIDEWVAGHPGRRLVVFCHGSVVNVFAARVLGLRERVFLDADYASASRFTISRHGVRSVKSLNETGYL